MQKAALRQKMLQKRRSYLPAEVERRSQQICQQFFKFFPLQGLRILHVFLPIMAKNEVNTWLIVEYLRVNFPAVHIAVPVINPDNVTLSHYLFSRETQLVINKWDIPEPVNATLIAESAIDLVLVPLLAFDAKGHRVGYGKGYYDRFLKFCRPNTRTVGLSLEVEPVPQITDLHAGDIALQYVVTPTAVHSFA